MAYVAFPVPRLGRNLRNLSVSKLRFLIPKFFFPSFTLFFVLFYCFRFKKADFAIFRENDLVASLQTSRTSSSISLNDTHACHLPNRKNLRFCQLQAVLKGDQHAAENLHPRPDRAYLSTCTAAKNAGDLLPEFIVRNYLAGVDHFIIYDNNQDSAFENVTELLRPFAPLVTITHLPPKEHVLELIGRPGARIGALNAVHELLNWHCFLSYGNTTKWLMSIDADEFLEAKDLDSLHEASIESEHIPFMHRFLHEVEENVPAQIGRWDTVLTRGIIEPPSLPKVTLAEKYPISCGPKDTADDGTDFKILWASKTAVQPRFMDYDRYSQRGKFFLHGVKHWLVPKATEIEKELYFSGKYEDYTLPFNSTESKWYIVHYWSRSYADYLLKKERGRMNSDFFRTSSELIWREKLCKKYHQRQVSKSAERRSSLVKDLLREMPGFDEIQEKYRDAAITALRQPYNQENLREYEEASKQLWPEPVS